MASLRIGQIAPEFTLKTHQGESFTLSRELQRRPVVLMFYTLDGSPTCTQLLCSVNDELDLFARHGLTLVGVNHADPGSHEAFAKQNFLRMPLLSDEQFEVAARYDSLFHIGPIKAIRYSVVGIGQDGRIRYLHHGRPSNEQILAGMGVGV